MQTRIIVFGSINDMLDFVKKIENYPYKMDMQRDNFLADPKSFFGLINIGIGKEIELRIYHERCEDLLRDIEPYVAA